MKQYLEMLDYILHNGQKKSDRTGTGTISVFGYQNRYDLSKGFPLVTTKKMFTHGIITELLWFLKGDTNIKYLQDHNVHIWDSWGDSEGNLGPVYGKQWRDFNGVDQISNLIHDIKTNPDSRRLILSAWNPVDIPNMALPPCHCLVQFYVVNGKLSCQLYQRSADVFLGVPFNIASYSLLTMMIAKECDLEVGEFIHTFGDLHIYSNHVEQVHEQLKRTPFMLPRMEFEKKTSIFDYEPENFHLVDYRCWPAIKGKVAV